VTAIRRRALTILRDHGPLAPLAFAELMWPDAPAWNTSTKAGKYGSTTGGGIIRAGGAYLAKLRKAGLVQHYPGDDRQHVLTDAGRAALDPPAVTTGRDTETFVSGDERVRRLRDQTGDWMSQDPGPCRCGRDSYPAPDDDPAAGLWLCVGCNQPTDACTCDEDEDGRS
jgi:hypothetical protein